MKFKNPKELAAFVKMVKRHSTWEGLAKEAKMTPKEARWTVYGIRSANGADACPLLDQASRLKKREKAVELRRKGVAPVAIAKVVRVSVATVCRWVKDEFGEDWQESVPRLVMSEDEARTKEIVKLSESMSFDAVGKRFGISRQRVHQIVKREAARASA